MQTFNPRKYRITKPNYAKQGGVRCPNCHSEILKYYPRFEEREDGSVVRRVQCKECGLIYRETYRLTGYEL